MIRILVVEDEPPIRRSIVRCIERHSGRFEVAGTALNGRQALELIGQTRVDAVFTDIRMPVMDGLELARRLRADYPDIAVVVISGYQDFSYVREALVSQVTDYLLKPATSETVDPVLDKLEQKIGALQLRRRRQELEDAIGGAAGEPAPGEEGARYGVFLVCAGSYPLVEDAMLPARAYWNRVDLESVMGSLLLEGEDCMCFAGKSSAEMVALARLREDGRIRGLAPALMKRLNEGSALAVTVGSSSHSLPIQGIGAALQSIRHKLHTELRLFSAEILWEGEDGAAGITFSAEPIARGLDAALRLRDREALGQAMRSCVEQFTQAGAAQIQLVHFLESLLNTHSNLFDPQTANLKLELRAAASNAPNADALAGDLSYLFSSLFGEDQPEDEKGREPAIIAQVEQYLRDNYEKSITNTVLSEQFGFVPSYLSKLFRTFRGLSPSEYLTRCRIEHAKGIMEREPEALFKEVAARVGFSDQYYFSKIFKKETGLWPTEFVKRK